jgi:hypothetical protein
VSLAPTRTRRTRPRATDRAPEPSNPVTNGWKRHVPTSAPALYTAEAAILVMLVAFALTVIATRWFLAITGYPKVGGGDLHFAHALWGGLLLFVASLLPLIWTGRAVHVIAAAASGAGIGLFIDEVGKFITTRNDYFYPAAAPIIYATFLLSVLVLLFVRTRRRWAMQDRVRDLAALIAGVTETAGASVTFDEEADVAPADGTAPLKDREPARLGATFCIRDADRYAVGSAWPIARIATWWSRRQRRWLGGRGLRVLTIACLLLAGVGSTIALVSLSFALLFVIPPADVPLFTLVLAHVAVDGIGGLLLFLGAIALAMGKTDRGRAIAVAGLLVTLVFADLLSFYLRQFDSIVLVLFHLCLLAAVLVLPVERRDGEHRIALA